MARSLVSFDFIRLGLWNLDGGAESTIRRRMMRLILSTRGTDTRIDGHLTHKLRI
jgi:hypothetical protein